MSVFVNWEWHAGHPDIINSAFNRDTFLCYLIGALDNPYIAIITSIELSKMMAFYYQENTLFTKNCVFSIKNKLDTLNNPIFIQFKQCFKQYLQPLFEKYQYIEARVPFVVFCEYGKKHYIEKNTCHLKKKMRHLEKIDEKTKSNCVLSCKKRKDWQMHISSFLGPNKSKN